MAATLMSSLDDALKTIDKFDFAVEVPRLERHNKHVGKDYIIKHPQLIHSIATFQFSSIKSIPNLARRMQDFIQRRTGTAGECCALAAVLAYIANPDDVLPDDKDGSVGFLDDAAILSHVAAEFLLPILKPKNLTQTQLSSVFDIVCLGIPMELCDSITDQITLVSSVIEICLNKTPEAAERFLRRFLLDMNTLDHFAEFLKDPPKQTEKPKALPPSNAPSTTSSTAPISVISTPPASPTSPPVKPSESPSSPYPITLARRPSPVKTSEVPHAKPVTTPPSQPTKPPISTPLSDQERPPVTAEVVTIPPQSVTAPGAKLAQTASSRPAKAPTTAEVKTIPPKGTKPPITEPQSTPPSKPAKPPVVTPVTTPPKAASSPVTSGISVRTMVSDSPKESRIGQDPILHEEPAVDIPETEPVSTKEVEPTGTKDEEPFVTKEEEPFVTPSEIPDRPRITISDPVHVDKDGNIHIALLNGGAITIRPDNNVISWD